MEPKKPNVLIIGSAKCGTTTLAQVLDEHPDCCLSKPKEVRFFDLDKNYQKGELWYSQHFAHHTNEKVIIDATPNYAAMPNNRSAERIYNFNPEMKLVYIVRNPIARLVSSWKMHLHHRNHFLHKPAKKGFESYVSYLKSHTTHWCHYKYGYQLNHYKKFFPTENIHVMFLEDLINNEDLEFNKLYAFLGIAKPEQIEVKASNTAEDKRTLTPFFRFVYDNKLDGVIKKIVPEATRNRLKKNIKIHEKMTYPEPLISENLQIEFINYVNKDITLFLNEYGKTEDFWQLKF
ncbi:sulfotransferase family protein [Winogradskyella aurantia]|uniref:Sulfotransferase domain-containing protein n=1 Tax=Winogradskyella aurantia TaxID=1915063 RepID=A0A265UVA1_9FLAO|nr:sulfotransferase [Winogradskyella aurantia]OZV69243.1 hypothetical protein CA834_07240 [Winogradskyella aurantia]